ncbi:phosphatase PAP2 family protein [Haloferula sp.]|uniref:phosphatase PAP2 family protein n=1 Tax=Haloferula sp. TaxID=2497595 RepID=UPI00329EF304
MRPPHNLFHRTRQRESPTTDAYSLDSAPVTADKLIRTQSADLPTHSPTLLEIVKRRAPSGILVVLWIIIPYSLLQQVAIREILWVKPSAFDLAIPVNFHSLWFYLSFYGLLAWIGLGVDDHHYKRYIRSIAWTALVSHLIFFLIPNGVTREAIDAESAPVIYQWLILADEPRNAFPSLHASLSILAGLAASASSRIRKPLKILAWLWILGIFWSTIALRQHYAVDLISGGGLALVVWLLVGRALPFPDAPARSTKAA